MFDKDDYFGFMLYPGFRTDREVLCYFAKACALGTGHHPLAFLRHLEKSPFDTPTPEEVLRMLRVAWIEVAGICSPHVSSMNFGSSCPPKDMNAPREVARQCQPISFEWNMAGNGMRLTFGLCGDVHVATQDGQLWLRIFGKYPAARDYAVAAAGNEKIWGGEHMDTEAYILEAWKEREERTRREAADET